MTLKCILVASFPTPSLRQESLVSAGQMLDTLALKHDSNRAFASKGKKNGGWPTVNHNRIFASKEKDSSSNSFRLSTHSWNKLKLRLTIRVTILQHGSVNGFFFGYHTWVDNVVGCLPYMSRYCMLCFHCLKHSKWNVCFVLE